MRCQRRSMTIKLLLQLQYGVQPWWHNFLKRPKKGYPMARLNKKLAPVRVLVTQPTRRVAQRGRPTSEANTFNSVARLFEPSVIAPDDFPVFGTKGSCLELGRLSISWKGVSSASVHCLDAMASGLGGIYDCCCRDTHSQAGRPTIQIPLRDPVGVNPPFPKA